MKWQSFTTAPPVDTPVWAWDACNSVAVLVTVDADGAIRVLEDTFGDRLDLVLWAVLRDPLPPTPQQVIEHFRMRRIAKTQGKESP